MTATSIRSNECTLEALVVIEVHAKDMVLELAKKECDSEDGI